MTAANVSALTGEVVWYVTGRFYETGDSQGERKLQDAGYFLHVQGLPPELFAPLASEREALLTFLAEPFVSRTITNGALTIGVDLKGSFGVYLREAGGASFDDPSSFAIGERVALLERVALVPTTSVTGGTTTFLSNVFTARLAESRPFTIGNAVYDFRHLVGEGVTQWGTAEATADDTSSGVPFVGSAIRIGNARP